MIWKIIRDFPNYEVSTEGTVRNILTGRACLPQENHNGYLRVRLLNYHGRRWVRIHLLVLEAFRGYRPSTRHHGAHGPGGQHDNRLANLEWKLPEENEADKIISGTTPRGSGRKLSSLQYRAIEALLGLGWSLSATASAIGVHRRTVSRIARGERRVREAA